MSSPIPPSLPASLTAMRLPLGAGFTFTATTGTVISDKVWSESNVSGGGGSGIVMGGYGGSSTAPVTTKITNKREFWVRDDAGLEHSFIGEVEKIQVREGQRVTVLTIGRRKKTVPLAVRNYTTGKTEAALVPFALVATSSREIAFFMLSIIPWVFAPVALLAGTLGPKLLAAFVICSVYSFYTSRRAKKIISSAVEFLNGLPAQAPRP